MDLSLLFLHRQGLAERPWGEDRPTCRLQGSSRRSGRFESVALSSAGANGLLLRAEVCRGGVFPVSVSLGVYRRGKANGWRLEG
jgi:hypothetical protein